MTSKLPTLDVVVPCYNEADTIEKCIDALLAQGDGIASIIIVDNNSTDETVGIVKRYRKQQSRIKLIEEKRQGVQFARNTGFDAAKADIIGRIDADTIVCEDWARAIRTYYADHPNVGAGSGTSTYYDLPARRITDYFTDLFSHAANQKIAESHLIYGANMSLRRSTWQAIKADICMITGIMEDQDLGYHVMQSGAKTGYITEAKANVSGRRMRMSPLRYWRYNKQWWMTYANHGLKSKAFKIRVVAWFGNILQALVWVPLQVHDPVHNRFSLSYLFRRKNERRIP